LLAVIAKILFHYFPQLTLEVCTDPESTDKCKLVWKICPDYRQALFFAPGYPEDQEFEAPTNCSAVWFTTMGFAIAGFLSFTFLAVGYGRKLWLRVQANRRLERHYNIVREPRDGEDEEERDKITAKLRNLSAEMRNYGSLLNAPTSHFDLVAALSGAMPNPSAPPPPPRCPTAPTTTTAEVYSIDNEGFSNM